MKVVNKRILIDRSGSRTRVAVTQQGELLEYDIAYGHDSPHAHSHRRAKNAIHNAVIKSIRPELGACFVQYTDNDSGNVKDGFLPFSNISSTYFNKHKADPTESEIAKLVKPGQKILVQIKKDQLHHETKGAALTTFISLAGTYLVLLPLNQKQGISRKADTTQRDLIKETIKKLNVSEEMGIIIRTAGISASHEEIEWDYRALLQQWDMILQAHKSLDKPCLIHEDENIVTRIIRDNMSGQTDKIICNCSEAYSEIKRYLETIRPDYLDKDILELYDHDMMFEHYSIEDQVESIFQVRVSLPSGGQIVMHGTEAGYMIDVNSSKSTYGSSIEENALNTNKEAAVKIADMLRLRDVSGIIHIDFIDMNEEKNRALIEKTFQDRTLLDRAKIKTENISLLTGCMSVLRQGMGTVFFKSSLEQISNDETVIIGKRRSVVSYSNHILNVIEKSASQKTDIIQIQLPVDVSTLITNELRAQVHEIEKKHNVTIYIIPNENFRYHRYILKRFHKDGELDQEKSYEISNIDTSEKNWIQPLKQDKPQISRNRNSRVAAKPGVLLNIWNSIFGEQPSKKITKSISRKSSGQRHSINRSTGTRTTGTTHKQKRHEQRGNHIEARNSKTRGDLNKTTDFNQKQLTGQRRDDDYNYNTISNEPKHTKENRGGNRGGNAHTSRRRNSSQHRTRKPRPNSYNTAHSETNKHIGQFDDD
ncbi:MAG: Rne/Rng family ribonuclease [Pseudomonadota bacterium]|nr:Rne/Rng family ribonuclease [Pseudomonadota bacterium]